jgi:hypothetical protein
MLVASHKLETVETMKSKGLISETLIRESITKIRSDDGSTLPVLFETNSKNQDINHHSYHFKPEICTHLEALQSCNLTKQVRNSKESISCYISSFSQIEKTTEIK